jgi:hypothetical protein
MSLLVKPINPVDAVYYDSVHGVAGTTYPVGTPTMPVNNFADLLLILAARNLSRVVLRSSITFTADVNAIPNFSTNYNMVFEAEGNPTMRSWGDVQVNLNSFRADGVMFRGCYFNDATANASMQVFFERCQIFRLGSAGNNWSQLLFKECLIHHLYVNSTPEIQDSLFDAADLHLVNAGGLIYNCFGSVTLYNMVAGTCEISSSTWLNVISGAGNAGIINLFGPARITNNGTSVINSYANNPRAEIPVNITAIVASETNFLNLATASFHYTIDDLILKCADPNPNTVNVKLYKLVNAVLTNTKTFAITTANAATYFDINTMFGLKSLAGDNIKITVQATGGGPYTITGSYAARNA